MLKRDKKLTAAMLPLIRAKTFYFQTCFSYSPQSNFAFQFLHLKKEQYKHRINIEVTYMLGHNFICADRMRNYFMYKNRRRNNKLKTPNLLSPVVIEL